MILLAGGARNDGPAWYRVELPARWLRAHGIAVRTCYTTVVEADIEGGLDTFSTQRGFDPTLLAGIRSLNDQKVRTVYEMDDDIWSVPSWSAARSWFTDERVRSMEAIMRACNEVTVSTDRLARLVVRQGVGPIHVVPNGVPLDLIPAMTERTKPGVRVGWWGSNTHQQDLAQALPAMRRLLRERPEVTLVFMGAPLPKGLEAGPTVEWHDWVEVGEFYKALRALELDVVVTPLVDHRFNYAKSNIKILEAAAMGYAIVASDVGPYQCIRNGETGLKVKANRPDLWSSLLMDVVSDDRLRVRLGVGARAWVEKEGNMDVTGPLWAKALGADLKGA